MSTEFIKHIFPDSSIRYWQTIPGRYIDEGQYQLVEWLASGNIPEEVVIPPEPVPVDPQTLKSDKLKVAENNFILLMRSVGLSDKADSIEIEQYTTSLENTGNPLGAIKFAIKSLAVINDVTQNNGSWSDISWHTDVE